MILEDLWVSFNRLFLKKEKSNMTHTLVLLVLIFASYTVSQNVYWKCAFSVAKFLENKQFSSLGLQI